MLKYFHRDFNYWKNQMLGVRQKKFQKNVCKIMANIVCKMMTRQKFES